MKGKVINVKYSFMDEVICSLYIGKHDTGDVQQEINRVIDKMGDDYYDGATVDDIVAKMRKKYSDVNVLDYDYNEERGFVRC